MASVKLVNVNKVYDGGVHAVHDFSIDIKDKEFIVFVGPSGCGKSTTLRMIAGLEEISYGEFYIDDKLMNSAAPKDRDIAMVFQSYALYPQMTVYDNMAYALKLRKVPKDEIDRRVREAAAILKLTPYLDRKPRALSGGQRQRVALGRSIVRRPKVFLMDEPLSNLDAKLRVAMRSEIVRIHEEVGATTIYVTHDQIEAMTMASRIVVMKDGFIQQIGTPNEVYQHPANLFVAGFIGTPAMNFLYGKLSEDGKFYINGCDQYINMTPEQMQLLNDYVGHGFVYGIRPENLIFEKDERFERYKNASFEISVRIIELLGDILNVHGKIGETDVIIKMPNKYDVKEGDVIKVAIESSYERFFNETTTKAITPDYCKYEEIEVTQSLDEDNVTIIEEKKSGIFSRMFGAVKNLIGKLKKPAKAVEKNDGAVDSDKPETSDASEEASSDEADSDETSPYETQSPDSSDRTSAE